MPIKACLDPNAINYGEDANGNFHDNEEMLTNDINICEYSNPMNADEEMLGEELGTEYLTHEEATIRGTTPTTDRERNRAAYIESQTTEKRNATLIFGGLVLYYLFGGF